MKTITRRSLLLGAPCACLAGASKECCSVPAVFGEAVRIAPGLVTIELAGVPELGRSGGFVKVVDERRKLQILVARVTRDRFVALDQKCTHGGGALTYVHAHQHLYCTCWGHSKFALDGSVIRWPNQQTPRPIRAHAVTRRGQSLEIRVEGLA